VDVDRDSGVIHKTNIRICPKLEEEKTLKSSKKYEKFWEELIAYYPLIRHGPIENDASNSSSIGACVSVAAVTFLPSRCLGTIGGYTLRHTD
jgi:hypothetical protein